MKPSKLQDHLRRCHPDKTEKDLKYFQTLKDKFQKIPILDRMFASTSQRNDDGLRASYNISLLIAKSGKCNYLQTTHFSIQLDESTLPDNAALLLAYVRFIMNQEIYEELLFARNLITDTKGVSIFHVLKDYFIEKAIPSSNIISVATDGAPAMMTREIAEMYLIIEKHLRPT
ncbi:unnamed protein product [Acanthoscelides obtectus]|uniref:Uncharacterized protein n=1 Tax=Acanthoscelides obtectus TaxID=200917 RepID=A0A9P0L9K8_ACAOB|nr:unnamed protein product [Acanthoscelides obtectus]CAK1638495.1 Protein ZBED8 [Acanthoscelides obtectus]